LFNVILKDSSDTFYSTNFILFSLIEILNIIFAIIIFISKDELRKPLLILYILYSIVTFLVPVFCIEHAYSPTGSNSELTGLALDREYRDIYGVEITGLANIYRRYI
jgi:hypothetical protein